MAINSSNSTTAQALAEPDLLKALVDLANLRDEPAAYEWFWKRWPGLTYVSDDDPAEMTTIGEMGEMEIPTRFLTMDRRKEDLRSIWQGDSTKLNELLLSVDPPEELQEKGIYIDRNSTDLQVGMVWTAPVEFDWQKGQLVYEPRTEFQRALYKLFRQSALAKVCGNSDCPAPYFIALKTTQRYCSEKCAEVFQKEWKRRWWKEHGENWRHSRKKSKRKPRDKR